MLIAAVNKKLCLKISHGASLSLVLEKIPYAKCHGQEKDSVWNMGLFLVTGASSSTQKL